MIAHLLNSPKISFFLWGVTGFIIAGLYSGSILVKIVMFRNPMPFHDVVTLAKCVKAEQCNILVTSRNSNYLRLTRGLELTERELHLHVAVQSNPVQVVKKPIVPHIFAQPKNKFNVLFSSRITSESLRITDANHSRDEYYLVDDGFPDPWCFPTRKKSNLTALLSRASFIARERGLTLAVYQRYLPVSVNEKNGLKQLHRPLTFQMLSGSLMIWSIGLAVALFLFGSEFVTRNVRFMRKIE